MNDRAPAEVFPPGEILKDELDARGWTQADFAEILGRPPRLVSELVQGKRAITPETAKGLGEALNTGAQFWLNLETAYQLWKLRQKGKDSAIGRRARLYSKAPIKEMVRRHWLEPSASVEVLEKKVLDFFELASLDAEPHFWAHAARKATSYEGVTAAQTAWLFRARHLARALHTAKYSEKAFDAVLGNLKVLLRDVEEARRLPRILAEAGIRFVVVEPLPQTRIDGACFWLDQYSPVIAVSLRYDRVDSFWFTVFHELGHVKSRDGLQGREALDVDLVGDQPVTGHKPTHEQRADQFASEALIAKSEIDHFVARVRPLFSKTKIAVFAVRLGVHPGIVVGQLHGRGEIPYSHNREMLARIRSIVAGSALCDGWGSTPAIS